MRRTMWITALSAGFAALALLEDGSSWTVALAAVSPLLFARPKPRYSQKSALQSFPLPAVFMDPEGNVQIRLGDASDSFAHGSPFLDAISDTAARERIHQALSAIAPGSSTDLELPLENRPAPATARVSRTDKGFWVTLLPDLPAASNARADYRHDALTGLANRTYFLQELAAALKSRDETGKCLAVLFVDIDHFKVINESLGHVAGDKLLDIFAQRLRATIRPTDFIARTSADEFAVLFSEIGSADDAQVVSNRILKSLQGPVSIDGRTVVPGASLGLSLAEGNPTADELLREADIAMFRAKQSGRNRLVTFTADMSKQAVERLELESELRRALEEDHFILNYQPIVDLTTSEIMHLEALIRWQHPEQGMISPMRFIPIAEDTGLILPIGDWVLREACRQTAQWQWEFGFNLGINVNLSALQLQSQDLVDTVQNALQESGLSPEYLKLEITESMMMENLEEHLVKLNQLRDMGVKIAVDDFGTGYSSMAYLSRLPLTTLKIDRSFVSRIGVSKEDDAIVRSIIGLAKALNLSVTSEGVETEAQLKRLQELDCDHAQGYYFSKPLPVQGIFDLLNQYGVRAA